MKNKFFLLFIFYLTFYEISTPQWGLLRRMGIGGGIHFGILNPSLSNLDEELKKYDLPQLNKLLFGFGGGGNLTIGGIRIGGFGIGASTEEENIRSLYGTNYYSKINLEYGVGFGTVGYELYHSKTFSVNVDLGIGGGSLDLYISDRTTNYNSWNEVLLIPAGINNITRKLSYSFFSLLPTISFEYFYENFIKFFMSGDYNFILNDKWTKDNDFKLINVPKMNFQGPSIRFGIYVGLYF